MLKKFKKEYPLFIFVACGIFSMMALGYYGIGNLLNNQLIIFDESNICGYWAVFLSIFWLVVAVIIRFKMFENEIEELKRKYEELSSAYEKDSEYLYEFSKNTRKIVFTHIVDENEENKL